MRYTSERDAAGGRSVLQQETDAAERAYDQRIDAELAAIDDRLHEQARRLLIDLHADYGRTLAPTNAQIRRVLNVLRDVLRQGVEAAASGGVAARILETER